jgi:hypothetical protein
MHNAQAADVPSRVAAGGKAGPKHHRLSRSMAAKHGSVIAGLMDPTSSITTSDPAARPARRAALWPGRSG